MKDKRKPVVGETLYLKHVGWNTKHVPLEAIPVIVTKVGRKFFTVGEGRQAAKFCLGSWEQSTEYSRSLKLYETEQEWRDEIEEKLLCLRIKESFEYGHNKRCLPLDALRAITSIIDEQQKRG